MPWFPDFVTAAELARRQTRDPGQAVPAGRYLTSLSEGDTRPLEGARGLARKTGPDAIRPRPAQRRRIAMEYLVTMTTHVPDGTPEQAVDDVRAREAAHSRDLATEGQLLRLWRPPLQPGEWRSLGLFAAATRPAPADPGFDAAEDLANRPGDAARTAPQRPGPEHPARPVRRRIPGHLRGHDPGWHTPPGRGRRRGGRGRTRARTG